MNKEVEVIDAYCKEKFILKAILIWTIIDFSTYGNLFPYAIKSYFVCPVCSTNTYTKKLVLSFKMCYRGH